jgi:hypothetical protein
MSGLSSIPAGISVVIKIFEFSYALQAANDQIADLLSTTLHVSRNVSEARRLRRLKENLLDVAERAWIDAVIVDNESALREIAILIEPSRVDMTTKKRIDLKHRATWVFRDGPKVRDKHSRLNIAHQTLGTVLAALYNRDSMLLKPSTVHASKDQPPPPYEWPHRRRLKEIYSLKGSNIHPDEDQPPPVYEWPLPKRLEKESYLSTGEADLLTDSTRTAAETLDCSGEDSIRDHSKVTSDAGEWDEIGARPEHLGHYTRQINHTKGSSRSRGRGSWLAYHTTPSF